MYIYIYIYIYIYTYMCTRTFYVFLFEIGVTKHKLNKLDCVFTIIFC